MAGGAEKSEAKDASNGAGDILQETRDLLNQKKLTVQKIKALANLKKTEYENDAIEILQKIASEYDDEILRRMAVFEIGGILEETKNENALNALLRIMRCSSDIIQEDAIEMLSPLKREEVTLFIINLLSQQTNYIQLTTHKKAITALGESNDERAVPVLVCLLEYLQDLYRANSRVCKEYNAFFLVKRVSEALQKLSNPLAVPQLEQGFEIFYEFGKETIAKKQKFGNVLNEFEWGPLAITLDALEQCGITEKTIDWIKKLENAQNENVLFRAKTMKEKIDKEQIAVYDKKELYELAEKMKIAFKKEQTFVTTQPRILKKARQ